MPIRIIEFRLGSISPIVEGRLKDANGPVDVANVASLTFKAKQPDGTYTFNGGTAAVVADPTFTAVAATDVCTATAHGLKLGWDVFVKSSTTLPAGLNANQLYYLVNVTPNTFQLSLTKGGAAVDITDTGTGTHTVVAGRAQYTPVAGDVDTAGVFTPAYFSGTLSSRATTWPNEDAENPLTVRVWPA